MTSYNSSSEWPRSHEKFAQALLHIDNHYYYHHIIFHDCFLPMFAVRLFYQFPPLSLQKSPSHQDAAVPFLTLRASPYRLSVATEGRLDSIHVFFYHNVLALLPSNSSPFLSFPPRLTSFIPDGGRNV